MNNGVGAGRPMQDRQATLVEDLGEAVRRLECLAERLENFPRRIGIVPDSPEVPSKQAVTQDNLTGHLSRLRVVGDQIEYNLQQIERIA